MSHNPSWFQTVLLQLVGATPVLLVYLGGMAAAAAFWRRCPTASAMALGALVILLFFTLLSPAVTMYLIQHRSAFGWSDDRFHRVISVIYVAFSIGHAMGLGLLIAAVFQGRRPAAVGNEPSPYPHTSIL